MRRRASVLLAALLLASCSDDAASPSDAGADFDDLGGDSAPPVVCEATTAQGDVRGEGQAASCVYRGIPFAEPPVGELRWKAPQAPESWTGARDATEYGFACPQYPRNTGVYQWGPIDEDCLTLNVWTPHPEPAAPAPVIVFFNKGDMFVEASSRSGWTDGTDMAETTGTVVVTFNSRLAALGYLAHPALGADSGNYGALDQIAALEWVKANIAAFGGDPGNVTIVGGSTHGAQSVCVMLVSPKAEGLFHKAIMHSGGCPFLVPGVGYSQVLTRAEAEAQGATLAEKAGCSAAGDVAACLRAKPEKEIRDALATKSIYGLGNAIWGPIVDGALLAGKPAELVESGGLVSKVPLLLGTLKNDGYGAASALKYFTEQDYVDGVKKRWGAKGDAILAEYPAADFTPPPGSAFVEAANWAVGEMWTDLLFACPTRRVARAVSAAGAPTYLYWFTLPTHYGGGTTVDPFIGTRSNIMKIFVFHTPQETAMPGWAKWPFTEEEEKLSWTIMGYWTRFARTGDPSGDGAIPWPRYDAAGDQHLELGETVEAGSGLKKDKCDFWDAF